MGTLDRVPPPEYKDRKVDGDTRLEAGAFAEDVPGHGILLRRNAATLQTVGARSRRGCTRGHLAG